MLMLRVLAELIPALVHPPAALVFILPPPAPVLPRTPPPPSPPMATADRPVRTPMEASIPPPPLPWLPSLARENANECDDRRRLAAADDRRRRRCSSPEPDVCDRRFLGMDALSSFAVLPQESSTCTIELSVPVVLLVRVRWMTSMWNDARRVPSLDRRRRPPCPDDSDARRLMRMDDGPRAGIAALAFMSDEGTAACASFFSSSSAPALLLFIMLKTT